VLLLVLIQEEPALHLLLQRIMGLGCVVWGVGCRQAAVVGGFRVSGSGLRG